MAMKDKAKSVSKFFVQTLGANLKNDRWSWGAVDPIRNRLFLRVWDDQISAVGGQEQVLVLSSDWRKSGPGCKERIKHLGQMHKGTSAFGVVCEPRIKVDGSGRSIKKFDDTLLLLLGEVVEFGDDLYAKVIDRVEVDALAQQQSGSSTLSSDLEAVLKNRKIDSTTKEALVNARLGQGLFRAQVLSSWVNACAVTGIATTETLRASHIRPWRFCSDAERLDRNNGLPLVATLDALFDSGLVSFDSKGTLLISSRIPEEEREKLGLRGLGLRREPTVECKEYLSYHRDNVFQGSQLD